ncbi:mediator of RNA polymerase II transcription subunit 4 isoform X1 [Poecilia formosa]|uniref:mediator of RNA polymerase II transcription subunit 4 isoform X1 n=1 Tax=Poecilia formosa TaxID=48698 RepID=UPI0007B87CA1|nr:PREDICTED: mediator of RNA polymerase II transcription subunit 4 isoform X1 [Poecilia formosa]
MAALAEKSTKERLLSVLDDLEVLSRELIEMLALSRSQKLPQPGEDTQILELLVQRDKEFQELMEVAQQQGKVHQEMQLLEKEVEKRDSDIQQLQKQLKEAEHILATAVYQAKEKLKSIEKARKGSISSEEIIKYAHRISASNAVCAPLNWVPGDPRRPYPTDLEMRSGMLGHMANLSSNGMNGHLPGDALAAGRLPDDQMLFLLRRADASLPLAALRRLSGDAPSSPWKRLRPGAAGSQQGERGRCGGHVHRLVQQQQRLRLKQRHCVCVCVCVCVCLMVGNT